MAMHSRAFLLLRRDLVNLERFPLVGISAQPENDDLFSWSAKIEGLCGTTWEGGIFQVRIFFTEDFNYQLPEIHFMTVPFHPNVDARDGSPSLPHGNWGEESTVTSLLLCLQALLSNPELDEGCIRNPTAAKLFRAAPLTYKQMSLDCVTASLRVDAGLTPYDSESGGVTPLPLDSFADTLRESGKQKARLKPVSFDDYFTLWKGIATSIHGYKEPNEFLDLLKTDVYLNRVHHRDGETMTDKSHTKTADLEQRVNQHVLLKYGKSNTKPNSVLKTKSRSQRIEQLKQMYRRGMERNGSDKVKEGEESGEVESGLEDVDQLLEWTQNLDEQVLNTAVTTPNV